MKRCEREKEYRNYFIMSAILSITVIVVWFILLTAVRIDYFVELGSAGQQEGSVTLWEIMTDSCYSSGPAPAILWILTVTSVIFTVLGVLGNIVFALTAFVATFITLTGLKVSGSMFGIMTYTLDAHPTSTGLTTLLVMMLGFLILVLIAIVPMAVVEHKLKKNTDSPNAVSAVMNWKEEVFSNILFFECEMKMLH